MAVPAADARIVAELMSAYDNETDTASYLRYRALSGSKPSTP